MGRGIEEIQNLELVGRRRLQERKAFEHFDAAGATACGATGEQDWCSAGVTRIHERRVVLCELVSARTELVAQELDSNHASWCRASASERRPRTSGHWRRNAVRDKQKS